MPEETWEQKCIRHPAWARAREDYIENGMAEDVKWKRCVKSGEIQHMDDMCWTALLAAYPA